jgi:hypothetical protein
VLSPVPEGDGYEFMQLPRSGETVYGLVAGLYPTKYPTLPTKTTTQRERQIDQILAFE